MALTLSEIETLVRHEARDSELNLTSGTGLAVFNMLYRRYSALFVWPELTRTNTTTTVADTATYTWPTTNNYSDVKLIEIQNPSQDNKYVPIMPARSEIIFSRYNSENPSFPVVYKRDNNGTTDILNLAPAPSDGNLTIRIIGIAEPANLASGSDQTVFIDKTSDDGLVYLIAADYAFKRAQNERANVLLQVVSEILSRKSGKEILPQEIRALVGMNA
jgi:hypothetical protein